MKYFEIGLNTGIDHWYAGQVKCVGAFVKANLAVTATQRGYEPKVSKSNDAIEWKANEIYQGEWCLLYEAYDFEAYGGGISFRCRAVWQTISEPQLSTKPKIRAKRQANHLGPENKIPKLGNHHHYLVPKTQNTDTHVHQGETRIFFGDDAQNQRVFQLAASVDEQLSKASHVNFVNGFGNDFDCVISVRRRENISQSV